ncbi:MAG TPA: hypothetical protein VE912_16715, partial [Bacteroidales bacterium]|nr:hypothetical protein [Bacteroidales bacterium]
MIICPGQSGSLKVALQMISGKYRKISHGNRVFTIISFVTAFHWNVSAIISGTILRTGGRLN